MAVNPMKRRLTVKYLPENYTPAQTTSLTTMRARVKLTEQPDHVAEATISLLNLSPGQNTREMSGIAIFQTTTVIPLEVREYIGQEWTASENHSSPQRKENPLDYEAMFRDGSYIVHLHIEGNGTLHLKVTDWKTLMNNHIEEQTSSTSREKATQTQVNLRRNRHLKQIPELQKCQKCVNGTTEVSNASAQTEVNLFAHRATQTDEDMSFLETSSQQAASDKMNSHVSCQTEHIWTSNIINSAISEHLYTSVQTRGKYCNKSSETQTKVADHNTLTQTTTAYLSDKSSQPEVPATTQTDMVSQIHASSQTNSVIMDHILTQTDLIISESTASQTEKSPLNCKAIQTKSSLVECTALQTDTLKLDHVTTQTDINQKPTTATNINGSCRDSFLEIRQLLSDKADIVAPCEVISTVSDSPIPVGTQDITEVCTHSNLPDLSGREGGTEGNSESARSEEEVYSLTPLVGVQSAVLPCNSVEADWSWLNDMSNIMFDHNTKPFGEELENIANRDFDPLLGCLQDEFPS